MQCSVCVERLEPDTIRRIKNQLKMDASILSDLNIGAEEQISTTPTATVLNIIEEHNYARKN